MRLLVTTGLFLISLALCAQLESHKSDNGKWGFMNDETWVVQPLYQAVTEFGDYGIAGAKLNGKWGFIDRAGKTVLPFQYTSVGYEDGAKTNVTIKGKYGIVDLVTGQEIVSCQYDKPVSFDTGMYPSLGMVATVLRNGKEGILTLDGKERVACLYDPGSIQEEDSLRYTAKINKKQGMIDTSGKQLIPCLFDNVMTNSDGLVDTSLGKKRGLYSRDGKEIAACIYDNFIVFEPDGFAMVQLKGKTGLIDRSGVLVLPCTYDNDDAMMDDRAKLKKE